MRQDVRIRISGEHCIEGQWQEPVITEAPGRYAFRNEAHFLQFTEEDAETGAAIRSMVRFTEKMLRVTKNGALGSELEFIPGQRTLGIYRTGAGTISMDMRTEKLDLALEENRMEIAAEYVLIAGEEEVQKSRVRITVLPM